MSIISIGTISTMSVTLTSTTTTTTMKINSMGCFHCQSVNGSNPVCDDPFNSTRAFYEGYYQSSCLSGMKDRAGLYPSSACLKLKGYHSEFLNLSSQLWTRAFISSLMSVRLWILKMVGPKMQDFCPKINMLKENFLKTILQWIMVRQKVPKSYFQSQFSMSKIDGIFFKKKSFKNINLGDHFL